ncbi:MAG: alpha/beta fold hydrolase [Gammaproteobacteria bacterium]|nr:alpha/beta fold hydrolase [Gammaproteobacteria bacterium]
MSAKQEPDQWFEHELPDRDFIELAWFGEKDWPVLLLLHGLEGSYKSHYIQRILHHLRSENIAVCVAHFRSCGRKLNRLTSSYHSGISEDLTELLGFSWLKDAKEVYAAGFSLGGNVLLKWLGENPEQTKIKRAMAVSVPMKLDICANAINTGMSRVYQKHLIDLLKVKTRKKLALDLPGPPISLKIDLNRIENFWQFDDSITAPLHGFSSVQDYYQKASSYPWLKHITVPTLILQALDDPFLDPDVLPDQNSMSETVHLEVSEVGGHIGFIESLNWRQSCFLSRRLRSFFFEESLSS